MSMVIVPPDSIAVLLMVISGDVIPSVVVIGSPSFIVRPPVGGGVVPVWISKLNGTPSDPSDMVAVRTTDFRSPRVSTHGFPVPVKVRMIV